LATVTCEICQKPHLRQDSEAHITQNVFSHFATMNAQFKKSQEKVAQLEREANEFKKSHEKVALLERESKEARSKAKLLQQKVTVLENELQEKITEKELQQNLLSLESKVEKAEEQAKTIQDELQKKADQKQVLCCGLGSVFLSHPPLLPSPLLSSPLLSFSSFPILPGGNYHF
jgi:predicted nuclease with TOPRIM domain